MLKMVPTAAFTSMLDEPSSGSKSTAYLPTPYSGGTGMISSSSSDAMTHTRPVWLRQFLMVSLASTSSFCWISPCTFLTPSVPEDVDQSRATDGRGDDLGGERDVVEQIRELTRRFGEAILLIENEALDGRDGRLHESPGR